MTRCFSATTFCFFIFFLSISHPLVAIKCYSNSAKLLGIPKLSPKTRSYTFPCSAFRRKSAAKTVHTLTPYDIKVIGAVGDSLTAGNGIDAINVFEVTNEYRYKSFTIGGYKNYEAAPTLPNILRKYNPNIIGASTGICTVNQPCAKLNLAVPGQMAEHMTEQVRALVARMKATPNIDYKNDWKVVTMLIGGNDICKSCKNRTHFTADKFRKRLQAALDILHKEMPRTFVNLVTILDTYRSSELHSGFVCTAVHWSICHCASFHPFYFQAKLLNEAYQQETRKLVDSGRYDDRDDFTVVLQPFFERTYLPRTKSGCPDLSYFAPDCFHFSARAHAKAAMSLWNSMITPIKQKERSWRVGRKLKCPSQSEPYFYTKKTPRR